MSIHNVISNKWISWRRNAGIFPNLSPNIWKVFRERVHTLNEKTCYNDIRCLVYFFMCPRMIQVFNQNREYSQRPTRAVSCHYSKYGIKKIDILYVYSNWLFLKITFHFITEYPHSTFSEYDIFPRKRSSIEFVCGWFIVVSIVLFIYCLIMICKKSFL